MNKYKKGDILVGIKEKNGEGYFQMKEILKVYKKPLRGDQYLARDLCGNFITTMNDERFKKWGMLKVTIDVLPEFTYREENGRTYIVDSPIKYTIQEDLGEVLKRHFYKPAQRDFKKELKKLKENEKTTKKNS
jgi:hypothetical protein